MHGAHAVCDEVHYLLGGIDYARLLHGFRIVSETVHHIFELQRHLRARKLQRSFHLLHAGHGHDARNDRHVYSGIPHLVQEIPVNVVVKKHLRCKKFAARVHFFLHVEDVLALAL